MNIPHSLRRWFLLHLIVDYAIAVTFFFFPYQTLQVFGWKTVDPLAARLVAAALLAIGGTYVIARHADTEAYRQFLALKIVWSFAAVIGIILTMVTTDAPVLSWFVLALFALFSSVWVYYYRLLSRSRI